MNADKKKISVPKPDPCSSASIRGSSFLVFRRGIPRTDNGNYLWIQHFHSALNKQGRAGFVMANSAADARASEQEIREKSSAPVMKAHQIRTSFFAVEPLQ